MQEVIPPQFQPYQHPCIIELPGGYRVYGQTKERLSEGLTVLRENGIHFPSPTAVPVYQHYAEPPPIPLVPPTASAPITPAALKEEFEPFGYYKELYLQRQNRRDINDESYTSSCFITEFAQDIFENKSPQLIKPADIEILLDALEHLPLRAKQKLEPGMTYRSLIQKSKREKMETIAKSTQGKHISNFRSFIHWLMEAKFIHEDPTCVVNIADYGPKDKPKVAFDVEDLEKILHPKYEAKMNTPAKHWLPLMGLFGGMRLNEMAQLYVTDIVKVNGIWCYLISADRAGQSVKTASSVRYVPIHSLLIELGFLDYVEEIRSKGFDHLFPGLTWGKNGPAGNLSVSLNQTHLRRRCGITDPRKTIGCMRHTFATLASQSGLIPRVVSRMLGHAEDDTVLQKHYVDPAEVPECKRWLEKIEFPTLQVNRYAPGRFDKHLQSIKAKEEREGRRETANGRRSRKKSKEEQKKSKNEA